MAPFILLVQVELYQESMGRNNVWYTAKNVDPQSKGINVFQVFGVLLVSLITFMGRWELW